MNNIALMPLMFLVPILIQNFQWMGILQDISKRMLTYQPVWILKIYICQEFLIFFPTEIRISFETWALTNIQSSNSIKTFLPCFNTLSLWLLENITSSKYPLVFQSPRALSCFQVGLIHLTKCSAGLSLTTLTTTPSVKKKKR